MCDIVWLFRLYTDSLFGNHFLRKRIETNGTTSSEVGWRGGRPEGQAERPARRAVGSRVLVHGVLDQFSYYFAHGSWLGF